MSHPLPRLNPNVRPSVEDDVPIIHRWLLSQDTEGVQGTFLCNWGLTKEVHEEGRMLVYEDPATKEPVAYAWGGLVQNGILEVRADRRGQGIGRAMVEHMLALAEQDGEPVLLVECAPSTSVPFWEQMGFTVIGANSYKPHAYRFLHRTFELPTEGWPAHVTIEWFPEERKWKSGTPAKSSQTMVGRLVGEDLYLPERSLCLHMGGGNAIVVRVAVNGADQYLDKAKYDEANELGIERCCNGYYVDRLRLPLRTDADTQAEL